MGAVCFGKWNGNEGIATSGTTRTAAHFHLAPKLGARIEMRRCEGRSLKRTAFPLNQIMRFFPAVLLAFVAVFSGGMNAAEVKRRTITDYFLLLPEKYFEAPPAAWLRSMRSPGGGICDSANGYLKCIGDGGQPNFEAALFHFQDGRPLLAVCSGELEGPDSMFLEFFELGADGKMKKTARRIFPVSDREDRRFELPRHGRTVSVRDGKTGKVRQQLTWDGGKFAGKK